MFRTSCNATGKSAIHRNSRVSARGPPWLGEPTRRGPPSGDAGLDRCEQVAQEGHARTGVGLEACSGQPPSRNRSAQRSGGYCAVDQSPRSAEACRAAEPRRPAHRRAREPDQHKHASASHRDERHREWPPRVALIDQRAPSAQRTGPTGHPTEGVRLSAEGSMPHTGSDFMALTEIARPTLAIGRQP